MPIKRRRVMKEFKITEISAVDKPAVAGALATIIKRADPPVDPPKTLSKTLPEPKEATAMTIRKASDDAMTSMNNYIAKRGRGVARATSAEQWRKLNPDQYAALNATAGSAAPVAKRSASTDFMKLVDDVRREQQCDRTTAMEIARRVHNDEYLKFQAASA